MAEQVVINIAKEKFNRYKQKEEQQKRRKKTDENPFYGSTRWTLKEFEDNDKLEIVWHTKTVYELFMPDSLLDFLADHEQVHMPLKCYTEYSRDGSNFRAHPNYRNQNQWFDWLTVKYICSKKGETVEHKNVPAKCFGFTEIDDVKYAIVHPCEFRNKPFSVLLHTWFLSYTDSARTQPNYDLVDVECIVGNPFVYPDGDTGVVLEVKDYLDWGNEFT